jgi:MFS family permease
MQGDGAALHLPTDSAQADGGFEKAPKSAAMALPTQAALVESLRRFTNDLLRFWRIGDAKREAAVLIVDELAINAVQHGRTDMTLLLALNDAIGFLYPAIGVGIFALVGAGGAAVAPLAGRWADLELARPMTGAAFAVAAVAFVAAGIGRHNIVLLALAAILLDVAVQTSLILGQHTIYRLDPNAPARLNSAFIATFFIGGALGSQLGTIVYHLGGWTAVAALGAAMPLLALLYWVGERPTAGRVAG